MGDVLKYDWNFSLMAGVDTSKWEGAYNPAFFTGLDEYAMVGLN